MNSKKLSPINIIEVEEDANLRNVSWNQRFLDLVKQTYNLKHQEAVLFVNVARDRFRLVSCFYGVTVLILPPIDPQQKLSIYLEVSRFLRKFKSLDKAKKLIDNEIESAQKRLKQQKKMAKKVLKKL